MDKIEKMFLDLNSVLVKFWKDQGRPDKEVKIALLERMLNWYKKMGYITLDTLSEEPDKSLEEEVKNYFQGYWPGIETVEQCNTDLHFTPPAIIRLACHFAEWGAKHLRDTTKMIDKSLEEAAYKYSFDSRPSIYGQVDVIDAFKAGAEWAFMQGWTFDAHKGDFGICFDGNIDNLLDSLKDREEVTIQIRKK